MNTETSKITKLAKSIGISFVRAYRQKSRIKLYGIKFKCQCCGHTSGDGVIPAVQLLQKRLGKKYLVTYQGSRHGFTAPSIFVAEM